MRNMNCTDVPSKADARGRTVKLSERDFHIVIDRIYKFCQITTQKELAKILSVSQPTVSVALKKKTIPHNWLNKLSIIYYISSDYFITGNGYKCHAPTSSQVTVHKTVEPIEVKSSEQLDKLIRLALKMATPDQLTDELQSRMFK